jgi:glycerol uptake facilitator-like aquaporin
VTLARSASDTFAGIRPVDAPGFIVAQLAGAAAATLLFRWLAPPVPKELFYERQETGADSLHRKFTAIASGRTELGFVPALSTSKR